MLWFVIFFLVILKIPALYLAWLIWWAVKDPPSPEDGLAGEGAGEGGGGGGWWSRRRRARLPLGRRGPHGSPVRRPARVAFARARPKEPV